MAELTQGNGGGAALRELLDGGEPVLAPGAYDGLSARLVEQAGFPAVYLTGFGASASLLGRPDVGLLSFDEMAGHARRLVQAEDGKTPELGLDRVRELGFRLVIFPVTTLLVASHAVGEALARLRDDVTPAAVDVPGFDDFTSTIGLPDVRRLESRFAAD